MNQSKLQSLIESCTNIGIGMILSLITQLIVFPIYNVEINFGANLEILVIFTCVSLTRQYFLRRIFNRGLKNEG